MPETITLVGTGGMATACALLLNRQGHTVRLLARDAERAEEIRKVRENTRYLPGVKIPKEIDVIALPPDALAGAGFLVNAIPTQHIREVWLGLAPHVDPTVPIASVSKGIEIETLLRPTQIIADVLDASVELNFESKNAYGRSAGRAFATLSGPTVADELVRGLPASLVAASDSPSFAGRLQDAFNLIILRVYTNDDLVGVELAGATKNVIALAAGILDGLEAGINAKSALLARGLAEITRLGTAMGARPETFFGVAGVGDLATTCFSPSGRNRSCGALIGGGLTVDEALARSQGVVEGVPSTRSVLALANQYGVEMPITQALFRVLFEGAKPQEGIQGLMSRDPKPESF